VVSRVVGKTDTIIRKDLGEPFFSERLKNLRENPEALRAQSRCTVLKAGNRPNRLNEDIQMKGFFTFLTPAATLGPLTVASYGQTLISSVAYTITNPGTYQWAAVALSVANHDPIDDNLTQ
jgi:hypothetical protein